jgi:lipopolysaccharide transport system ATP-binding protein
MKPIIQVRNLSKLYHIGAQRASYGSLRESLASWAQRPLDVLWRRRTREHPTIWALKDINLDVMPGEVVGIIGRNGAGKSTLLKVLSRITEPTEGEVNLFGRVGSLLEVGTGFHPELTGRENIFLNGAVLGMRRAEIDRKFDEIVAFAEVEKFIDTPVKHYSSGMYVRLAFAVAAHLEPEILLVDEVLAVGDAQFQKKCLGKMGDVARGGRTVLLVSHNLAAITNLCRAVVVLEAGKARAFTNAEEGVRAYAQGMSQGFLGPPGGSSARYLQHTGFFDGRAYASPIVSVPMGEPVRFEVAFSLPEPSRQPVLGFVLRRSLSGEPVFGVNTRMTGDLVFEHPVRSLCLQVTLTALNLVQGQYILDFYLGRDTEDFEVVPGALAIEVVESDVFGTGQLPFTHVGPCFVKPVIEVRERS